MANLTVFITLLIIAVNIISKCDCTFVYLNIYSDFSKKEDVEYFKTEFPKLIDIVGSRIFLRFTFVDEESKSGPRMCALKQFKLNNYMQAEYLKCEAEGNTWLTCVNKFPINKTRFRWCVNLSTFFVRAAAIKRFRYAKINITPTLICNGFYLRPVRLEGESVNDLIDYICRYLGYKHPKCPKPTTTTSTTATTPTETTPFVTTPTGTTLTTDTPTAGTTTADTTTADTTTADTTTADTTTADTTTADTTTADTTTEDTTTSVPLL